MSAAVKNFCGNWINSVWHNYAQEPKSRFLVKLSVKIGFSVLVGVNFLANYYLVYLAVLLF